MSFETACEKALTFLSKKFEDKGFNRIWDIGDSWLFSGDDGSGLICYGANPIRIYKKTGDLEVVVMSDPSNWNLIDSCNEINELEVPQKYKVVV